MPEGVGHGQHRQDEGQGHPQEPDPRLRERGGEDGAAAAAEDQPEGTDALGGHPLTERPTAVPPLSPARQRPGAAAAATGGTSEPQKAQRRAGIGILLRHSGHSRVRAAGGSSGLKRSISRFTGSTTT